MVRAPFHAVGQLIEAQVIATVHEHLQGHRQFLHPVGVCLARAKRMGQIDALGNLACPFVAVEMRECPVTGLLQRFLDGQSQLDAFSHDERKLFLTMRFVFVGIGAVLCKPLLLHLLDGQCEAHLVEMPALRARENRVFAVLAAAVLLLCGALCQVLRLDA